MKQEILQKRNPQVCIKNVNDAAFSRYGKLIHLDVDALLQEAENSIRYQLAGMHILLILRRYILLLV